MFESLFGLSMNQRTDMLINHAKLASRLFA